MERSKRHSKKSNKSRIGDSGTNGNGNDEDRQSSNSGNQSPQQGISRSKPCREIYRPPNCRKNRNSYPLHSNSGQFHQQNYYSYNNANGHSQRNANNGNSYEVHNQHQPFGNCQLEFSKINSKESAIVNPQGFRPLNIHAKEFHFKPSTVDQAEPYGHFPGAGSNFYTLCQSKSSGNIAAMTMPMEVELSEEQKVKRQFAAQIRGTALADFIPEKAKEGQTQFYNNCNNNPTALLDRNNSSPRLQQSKSSGNIPGRSKMVRFFEENGDVGSTRVADTKQEQSDIFDQLLTSTRALSMTDSSQHQHQPRMPFLQKSRTTIQMGMGNSHSQNHQQQLLSNANYLYRNPQSQSQPQQTQLIQRQSQSAIFNGQGLIRSPVTPQTAIQPQIKRSKSFNAKSQPQSQQQLQSKSLIVPSSPNFGDFCINKWPKEIQESITTAVTGGDRVPPRHRINMVTSIFEALFNSEADVEAKVSGGCKEENLGKPGANKATSDLTVPAVQIFLYFIQREKDRTVLESVLNTSFATYQSLSIAHGLSGSSDPNSPIGNTKNKWHIFLSFLCTLYCQMKCLRIQSSSGSEQISLTILTLLCDSCLGTLRSLPICHSPETMDCLFTVMTSIGREMEKTFPSKMKQILTSVRDALLGLGPYLALTEAPALVQKTLMQLIELHAANWHLPASAVRYYYAHPAPNANASVNNPGNSDPPQQQGSQIQSSQANSAAGE